MNKSFSQIIYKGERVVLQNRIITPGFITDNYRLAAMTETKILLFEDAN